MTSSIRHGGTWVAAAGLLGFLAWPSPAALADVNVLERSYDAFRTGVNTAETILTPANVSSTANQFHRRFVMKVDGKIEGSPLYASGVTIAGGTHNVVYVATMHNTVYAFDADTGAQLSARWLGVPVRRRSWTPQADHHPPRVGHRGYPGDRSGDGNTLCRTLGLRERRQRADLPAVRPRRLQPQQRQVRLGADRRLQRQRHRLRPLPADAACRPCTGAQAQRCRGA